MKQLSRTLYIGKALRDSYYAQRAAEAAKRGAERAAARAGTPVPVIDVVETKQDVAGYIKWPLPTATTKQVAAMLDVDYMVVYRIASKRTYTDVAPLKPPEGRVKS